MHRGVGSRLVYRQLLAVGGLSFALSKRLESIRITCEQTGKRMEQNRAGGGARRLRIGVTTSCEVQRCDPRTGREPPKSGPSPPPPGRLYRALIKSIESEPVHHGRATDTKLHILLCSSRMLTTRPNEACNERAEQRPQPGPHTPRLTPPSARQPPWHLWCRGRARFRRRRRQCPPTPPS
jgi:hypothetical protein